MSGPQSDLGAALRAAGAPCGRRPSEDELADFAAGRLPEARAEEVREHLAGDPAAARYVLALGEFLHADPPAGEAPLEEGEITASWTELQARLEEPSRGEDGGGEKLLPFLPPVGRTPAMPWYRTLAGAWAAAAALAGLAIAGWLLFWLPGGGPPASQLVAVNPQIVFLRPKEDHVRGYHDEAARARLAQAGRGLVVFQLALREPERFREYRVSVLRQPAGSQLPGELAEPLVPQDEDLLIFAVPQQFLAPGIYVLRVHGVGGDQLTPVADYECEVPAPNAPAPRRPGT